MNAAENKAEHVDGGNAQEDATVEECGPSQCELADLAYFDLAPDTTYDAILRIDAPSPGSRATVSDPVFYTTSAAASPDCPQTPRPQAAERGTT